MRNRLRASWLGVILAVTITFAGCYPFQGDITLLLTPVPIDPTRQAEIQAALADARAEAAATAEVMTSEAEMVAVTATVTSNSLRVRQDADIDSPIVAGLRQGDTVQVVGHTEDGTWLQIEIPDVETLGWVSAEFVTVEGDVMALSVPGDAMAAQPATAEVAAPTPTPEATAPAVEEMAMEMTGLVLDGDAADLQIVDGVLTVPSITSSSAGWLVVHADDGGTFGPVIGYAAIAEGDNTDVAIAIDTEAATETVHLMLHEDGGAVGTYEFPGADAPVIVDGAPVSMAYNVGAPVVTELAGGAEAALPATDAETTTPADSEAALPATDAETTTPADSEAALPATDAETTTPADSEAAMPATDAETTTPADSEAALPVTGGETAVAPAASAETTAPAAEAATPAESAAAVMSAGEAAAMTGMTSSELATVNTRSLRVRSGPTGDAEIVGGALDGEVYPVAEKSADGKWVRLYFPGTEGEAWVGSEFVEVNASDLNVKYGNVTVRTGGGRLRVRNAPTLDAAIVGYVYDGDTRFAVGVSADGEWALLFLPALSGPTWVATDYVTYQ